MTQDSSVTNSPISLTSGWLGALQPNGTSFFLLHWPPPWWAGGPRVGSSPLSRGGCGWQEGRGLSWTGQGCLYKEWDQYSSRRLRGRLRKGAKKPNNGEVSGILPFMTETEHRMKHQESLAARPPTAQGKLTSRNRERSRIKATIFQRRKLTTTTSSDASQARAGVKRWNIWVVPAVNGTSTVNVPARTSTIAAETSHETCHSLCPAKIAYGVDTYEKDQRGCPENGAWWDAAKLTLKAPRRQRPSFTFLLHLPGHLLLRWHTLNSQYIDWLKISTMFRLLETAEDPVNCKQSSWAGQTKTHTDECIPPRLVLRT